MIQIDCVALIYFTCYRKPADMSHLFGASHLPHPNQVCLTLKFRAMQILAVQGIGIHGASVSHLSSY
jgi:hypothetical protein